jgi:hypothetical protein
MPDHRSLTIGDRIRLLSVPQADINQREHERLEGLDDAGWTADTLERIIAQDPFVTISEIDEHGIAWFEVSLQSTDGELEQHYLAVMDDTTWEFAAEAVE